MSTLTPEVLWAQRSNADDAEKNIVYLTINASEITPESLKFEIEPTKITFAGTNKSGQAYAVELELHAEIDPSNSKKHFTARGVEAILRKKEAKAEYWPRLLKDKRKVHWLKTDFDKWVDEDEQEEEEPNPMAGGFGANDPMSQFDFSKFGGGDMGGDMPELGGGEDDEDDDEMPDLEEVDKKDEGAKKA